MSEFPTNQLDKNLMEQQPTPIIEIIELILLMGSITYLMGAVFQVYILRRNRTSFFKSLAVVLVTRFFVSFGRRDFNEN
ncbi:hypothetical protein DFO77_1039 [Marinilabilia salmonicolor]|uniref:Uncharacterized protein n=1 Tax=Marinilabilia salmonicolor TaxID=989 RepID=A0A368VFU9_9BACT|nr:hypothetical protein DFO77_1039 [Marinilabilia salmonicolor]